MGPGGRGTCLGCGMPAVDDAAGADEDAVATWVLALEPPAIAKPEGVRPALGALTEFAPVEEDEDEAEGKVGRNAGAFTSSEWDLPAGCRSAEAAAARAPGVVSSSKPGGGGSAGAARRVVATAGALFGIGLGLSLAKPLA